jgi:hypothetical protein
VERLRLRERDEKLQDRVQRADMPDEWLELKRIERDGSAAAHSSCDRAGVTGEWTRLLKT